VDVNAERGTTEHAGRGELIEPIQPNQGKWKD